MGRDVAPLSFHLLSGMAVLGSVIGRRAALERHGGTLWPPTSVLLLGPSGTGKSLALKEKAFKVAQAAMGESETFYLSEGTFTVAGLVSELKRLQQHGADPLEGLHVEDEVSMILTKRTGNETVAQWIIKALAYQPTLEEKTVGRGKVVLKNLTVAFGFGTTLEYLRKSVGVDEFTGGFMNRFLIVHEADQRECDEPRSPSEGEITGLGQELVEIRESLGDYLSVSERVESRLSSLGNQAKKRHYDSIHLTGYWNRYPVLLLKLASLMAMAKGASTVEVEDLDMAQSLLDTKLYPVLEGLIDELGASWDKKKLIELSDSLRKAGPEGWEMRELSRRMNLASSRKQREAIEAMLAMGMIWQVKQRVYGTKQWAEGESDD
jgi:hypothetical protein